MTDQPITRSVRSAIQRFASERYPIAPQELVLDRATAAQLAEEHYAGMVGELTHFHGLRICVIDAAEWLEVR